MKKRQNLQGLTIADKYNVGPLLGAGSFGEVYVVYDIQKEKIYALKKENQNIKTPQLQAQYKAIKYFEGSKGFPVAHYCNYHQGARICIMDLLGPNLQDLLDLCDGCFSLKTVLMLAQQMIDRIQTLHTKNYVYRDIKPENFVMGIQNNSHILHIIDFGLSRPYKESKNNQHINYKQKKNQIGTLRYTSINSHQGIQYSRRDDLESLGYLLIYLAKGDLPWKGVCANNKMKKNQKILEMKMQIPVQKYTDGLPTEFSTFMNYCRSLKFHQRPDYSFLKRLFSDLFNNLGFFKDYEYDWCKLKSKVSRKNNVKIQINPNSDNNNETLSSNQSSSQNIEKQNNHAEINEEQIDLGLITKGNYDQNNQQYNEGDQNIDPDLLDDSEVKIVSKGKKWFESMF